MSQTNQYQAPQSNVEPTDTSEYAAISFTSAAPRLGRVRYIAYTNGFTLLYYFIFLGLTFLNVSLGGAASLIVSIFTFLFGLALVYLYFILTIQRCHDFNTSGWLSLLLLPNLIIPLIILVFWFIPGTEGPNRFGNTSPPHRTVHLLLALIIPVIAVVGILAAIAIPAYNSYLEAARQAAQAQ